MARPPSRGARPRGVWSATAPVATRRPQHAHVVGIGHHLAELVRDHHTEQAPEWAWSRSAQHLVGLLRVSTEVGSSRIKRRGRSSA